MYYPHMRPLTLNLFQYVAVILIAVHLLPAQPFKSFGIEEIASFHHITEEVISKNGLLMAWKTAPVEGDGHITILNNDTKDTIKLQRAHKVFFNDNSTYCLALVKPPFQEIRASKRAKSTQKTTPKDVLIRISSDFKIDTICEIEKLWFPDKTERFAYFSTSKRPEPLKDTTLSDSTYIPSKKIKEPKEKPLYFLNIQTGDTTYIGHAADVSESANGLLLLYTEKNCESSSEKKNLYLYSAESNSSICLDSNSFDFRKLLVSDFGRYLSWLSISDSTADPHVWRWTLIDLRSKGLKPTISDTLLENKYFNSNGQWIFSESERRLYLTLLPDTPVSEKPDTTLTDDERPEFDLYSHTDYHLMTWQLANVERLKSAGITAVFDLSNKKVTLLTESAEEAAMIATDIDQPWILTARNAGLDQGRNWEFPEQFTYHIVHTNSGKRTLVARDLYASAELSPGSKFVLWFDRDSRQWMIFNIRNQRTYPIGTDVASGWHNHEHDLPSPPPAYGKAGFTAGDKQVWLYDRYHIVAVDPEGNKKSVRVTSFSDSLHTVRYRRVYKKERFIGQNGRNVFLVQKNNLTKQETLLSFNIKSNKVSNRHSLRQSLHQLKGGEYGQWLLLREESYLDYPEIQTISTDLARVHKWTNAGQQYASFNIGNVYSFPYRVRLSNDSLVDLEGLIYIDDRRSEKIPAIVYFYEKSSDNLHKHHAPRFSRSIINPAVYVSHGYAVIIPDIAYSISNPGEDALRCVTAAVDEALKRWPIIDSDRLGLNGQSWGGYQVAYIITQTSRYKAAFAGAPVANMTSAYGGIRWGTGYSRISQYEKGQSRIGSNLWDDVDAYIRNSPLFHIPNTTTPLLIMHNDRDGAVPYYQGIELFMGLKRLNKPVWLLIYNKEDHNLTQLKNMKDLTVKTLQFYDHFLKDQPMQKWMKDGIPAHRKGLDF